MSFTYYPKGVCSQKIQIELAKDHTIQDIQIIGGCDGNLKGVRALCIGQKAEDVIRSLSGIHCGPKATSCPDHSGMARAPDYRSAGRRLPLGKARRAALGTPLP